MIRFYLKGMSDTNVRDDLIDEIFTDFYFPFAAGCFDLRTIGEWSSITDRQVASRHIDVLDEQGQRFPHANGAFVEQPDQEAITLVVAGIHQLPNLGLLDGFRVPSLRFLLLEQFFSNGLLGGNVVEKALVSSSACRQIRGRFVCKMDSDIIDAPEIVVQP